LTLFFYTLLTRLLLPLFYLRLWWRGRHQPEYRDHWPERLGYYPKPSDSRPLIWIHAVSVGETQAALPLIHALIERYPDHALLITHTTPTGRATANMDIPPRVLRVYLPYDLPGSVTRFLDTFKPVRGFLLETELWPRLIDTCHQRHIPLILANARLSERSARRYARIPTLVRGMLRQLTHIAAQSPADAYRFEALGARTPVTIMGNLKFDAVLPRQHPETVTQFRQWIGERQRRIWVAASTRDGEEVLLLPAIYKILQPPNLLVLVPRHPQRFDSVADYLSSLNISFQRRSSNQPISPDCQVLLGDSMGELNAWYQLAQFAVMGGTLLPFGGQNLLEPLRVGCPVILGPHTYNFAEASTEALAQGAAIQCHDLRDIVLNIEQMLSDPETCRRMGQQGQRWIERERGATHRLLAYLSNPPVTA
jgi:3-deoxy-D-manno-octulosonic-acid transferase